MSGIAGGEKAWVPIGTLTYQFYWQHVVFLVNFFNLAPTVKGERTLETRLEVLRQEAHIHWYVSQISFINHLYIAVVLYVQAS